MTELTGRRVHFLPEHSGSEAKTSHSCLPACGAVCAPQVRSLAAKGYLGGLMSDGWPRRLSKRARLVRMVRRIRPEPRTQSASPRASSCKSRRPDRSRSKSSSPGKYASWSSRGVRARTPRASSPAPAILASQFITRPTRQVGRRPLPLGARQPLTEHTTSALPSRSPRRARQPLSRCLVSR